METKIKQRFVKDYNLPINIFDDELFNYYIELYDFFPEKTYSKLVKNIDGKYNGNGSLWLDYCANVRDKAIYGVIESDAYKNFNDSKNLLTEYECPVRIGEHSIYNEESDGKYFISIDLKKANFQALKFAGVINDATYEDFIGKYGGDSYIKGSKYLRQVIFGKMNAGRTIKVEKHIMFRILKIVNGLFPNWHLYSLNSDELVFKLDASEMATITKEKCEKIENAVKDELSIDVRAEIVEVVRLDIRNYNGNKVDAYIRHNAITGEDVLKKASTTFYPQIYKLYKQYLGKDGFEITDNDLYFYFEDQICKFAKPLTLNV